ncbi:MAG: VCBS repeat-containing protein, partial [Saprospiraceae bacterium]|nr:VCBS repeat-containing protein [Saprospiraceae bacterium]
MEEPTLFAENPVMRLLDSTQTGIGFENRIIETYENNITTNINMYNGGGLAVADINNDGLPDIYFVCSNGKNKLYLNQGNLTFKDITDASGVASEEGFETAVTAADVNNDGWLDLYVCRGGVENNELRRNRLFINNGNLTFTERSHEYGLDDQSACTGANFFDYDNDGDLDCYVLNYPTEQVYSNKLEAKLGADGKYHPLLEPRGEHDSDRLYRNDGGKFTDVSQKAGIWNLAYGLSVSVSDFNRDGYLDIYVGNDFVQPDRLYINNRNGTFSDQMERYFQHCSQHTMGTDLTDFDNDGLIDVFAVDMLAANNYRRKSFLATNSLSKQTAIVQHGYFEPVIRNVLQHNNGNGTFSDIGCISGVYQTDWSWSGLIFDMDNDGLRDMHVTNGYRREVTSRDFADFTFPEIKKKNAGKRLRDIYPNFNEFLEQVPTFKVRNFCFQNKGNWQFNDVGGDWMTMPAAWSCGAAWADF